MNADKRRFFSFESAKSAFFSVQNTDFEKSRTLGILLSIRFSRIAKGDAEDVPRGEDGSTQSAADL